MLTVGIGERTRRAPPFSINRKWGHAWASQGRYMQPQLPSIAATHAIEHVYSRVDFAEEEVDNEPVMAGWSIRRCPWSFALLLCCASLTGCSVSPSSGVGSNSAAGGSAHTVSLTWQPSTSNNVVAYNVYRGTTSGNYALLNSMNSSTSYTDTTVQGGQAYYYVVTAVDSSGAESPYSNVAHAVIP